MVRSGMFWQLFATYGILIFLSVGVLGMVLTSRLESYQLQEIEERLHGKALLIHEVLRSQNQKKLDERLLHSLVDLPKSLPSRVSLIGPDGKILSDTSKPSMNEDPRTTRAELIQASRDGFGMSIRTSSTMHQELMYVALRCELPDSPVAFIRVSMPLATIRGQVADLKHWIWLAAGLTALLGLLIAFLLARKITRPVHELIEGAEEIAAGSYGHRVYAGGRDEVGKLAQTFNRMSERLSAQFAQLDEDRQQLRAVLGSMVEGVVALDAEQRVLFANERAGQLLEVHTRNVVGRRIWEVVRHRPIQDLVRTTMAIPGGPSQEMGWTGPTGKSLNVHVACLPGSPPRGAVIVLHDTTELRRLERVRQEFIANVSHELKTPLAVIKACVETLIDGAADDPAIRGSFLDRIAEQGDRLHNLILDMLSLARIETETQAFTLEAVPVDQSVYSCLERHRTLAEGKNQVLEAVPPAEPEAVIAWADEEAVAQILDNLVDNACKYTPAGGHIRVHWERENGQVMVEVRDTGIGIPESELPRVFERFYRVDKARSREMGGTGLGLSIVKHLTQAMKGGIQAQSQPGQGSTFTVRLPAGTS